MHALQLHSSQAGVKLWIKKRKKSHAQQKQTKQTESDTHKHSYSSNPTGPFPQLQCSS